MPVPAARIANAIPSALGTVVDRVMENAKPLENASVVGTGFVAQVSRQRSPQASSSSRSCAATTSPDFTWIALMEPSRSARICDSIFMASIDTSGSPAFTT